MEPVFCERISASLSMNVVSNGYLLMDESSVLTTHGPEKIKTKKPLINTEIDDILFLE